VSASAEELWLAALQRLAARASHEIRNPLNGVVVNVEVLRTRLGRPAADPASLATFAELASGEIARSARLIEALLTLARPASAHTVDLRQVLDPLIVLYGAVADRNGSRLEVVRPPEGTGPDAGRNAGIVDALSARLAIATILDHSVEGAARVACWAARVDGAPTVGVSRDGGAPVIPNLERIQAALPAVRIEHDGGGMSIVFPALSATNRGD
jgi:signal transduction histidine kinase